MQPAAVVFDLFGTLLDIASLRTAAAAVCDDPVAFVATWREKQIAYAFASAIMDRYEDFDAMTGHGLRFAAAKHGVTLDDAQVRALITAWERVQPYPDAAASLATLHAAGVRCAVLTNGTRTTSTAAMDHAGISSSIDATFYVDSAGVYKPDVRVYALVTDHYACAPADIVFVTSNGWDATGGAAFGYRVAWCNRLKNPAETYGPPPTWTIPDLASLPALIASSR
jgi:2-haloacid dehalogenase